MAQKNQRIRQKSTLIAVAVFLSSSLVSSQNSLTVARVSLNSIEIRLENSDNVAGLQFSIRSSSQIVLSGFQRSDRTSDSQWIVSSYQPNDTTINVVILGSSRSFMTNGDGAVAKVSYRTVSNDAALPNRVSLTKVLIANPQAESLAVVVRNAEWGSSTLLAQSLESSSFKLGQNYPNPFNPNTKLAYSLSKAAQVRLSVYDVTGREIARLVDNYQFVGDYNVTWNSKDDVGGLLPSGVYFARIQVDNEIASSKMILAK